MPRPFQRLTLPVLLLLFLASCGRPLPGKGDQIKKHKGPTEKALGQATKELLEPGEAEEPLQPFQ
jgi:hypothetical protein